MKRARMMQKMVEYIGNNVISIFRILFSLSTASM